MTQERRVIIVIFHGPILCAPNTCYPLNVTDDVNISYVMLIDICETDPIQIEYEFYKTTSNVFAFYFCCYFIYINLCFCYNIIF